MSIFDGFVCVFCNRSLPDALRSWLDEGLCVFCDENEKEWDYNND